MNEKMDVRTVMTGNDGRLYVYVGKDEKLLAEVKDYEVKASFTNISYKPIGDFQEYAIPDKVKFTLTFSEAVIRDDWVVEPILKGVNGSAGQKPMIPYFSFKIRPLSEEEYLTARQNAVVKMANPNNPQLPPVEKEVKVEELSAWKIYYATVNRDTVWKNPEVIRTLEKRGCPIITVVDVINAVLMAGEKDTVDTQIDVISGYYGDRESLEDYAKN